MSETENTQPIEEIKNEISDTPENEIGIKDFEHNIIEAITKMQEKVQEESKELSADQWKQIKLIATTFDGVVDNLGDGTDVFFDQLLKDLKTELNKIRDSVLQKDAPEKKSAFNQLSEEAKAYYQDNQDKVEAILNTRLNFVVPGELSDKYPTAAALFEEKMPIGQIEARIRTATQLAQKSRDSVHLTGLGGLNAHEIRSQGVGIAKKLMNPKYNPNTARIQTHLEGWNEKSDGSAYASLTALDTSIAAQDMTESEFISRMLGDSELLLSGTEAPVENNLTAQEQEELSNLKTFVDAVRKKFSDGTLQGLLSQVEASLFRASNSDTLQTAKESVDILLEYLGEGGFFAWIRDGGFNIIDGGWESLSADQIATNPTQLIQALRQAGDTHAATAEIHKSTFEGGETEDNAVIQELRNAINTEVKNFETQSSRMTREMLSEMKKTDPLSFAQNNNPQARAQAQENIQTLLAFEKVMTEYIQEHGTSELGELGEIYANMKGIGLSSLSDETYTMLSSPEFVATIWAPAGIGTMGKLYKVLKIGKKVSSTGRSLQVAGQQQGRNLTAEGAKKTKGNGIPKASEAQKDAIRRNQRRIAEEGVKTGNKKPPRNALIHLNDTTAPAGRATKRTKNPIKNPQSPTQEVSAAQKEILATMKRADDIRIPPEIKSGEAARSGLSRAERAESLAAERAQRASRLKDLKEQQVKLEEIQASLSLQTREFGKHTVVRESGKSTLLKTPVTDADLTINQQMMAAEARIVKTDQALKKAIKAEELRITRLDKTLQRIPSRSLTPSSVVSSEGIEEGVQAGAAGTSTGSRMGAAPILGGVAVAAGVLGAKPNQEDTPQQIAVSSPKNYSERIQQLDSPTLSGSKMGAAPIQGGGAVAGVLGAQPNQEDPPQQIEVSSPNNYSKLIQQLDSLTLSGNFTENNRSLLNAIGKKMALELFAISSEDFINPAEMDNNIKKIQSAINVSVDGLTGKNTKRRLISYLKKKPSGENIFTAGNTLMVQTNGGRLNVWNKERTSRIGHLQNNEEVAVANEQAGAPDGYVKINYENGKTGYVSKAWVFAKETA
jgi:hypothetical protein